MRQNANMNKEYHISSGVMPTQFRRIQFPISKQKSFKCTICHKSFPTKKGLHLHNVRIHNAYKKPLVITEAVSPKIVITSKKTNQCKYCKKIFSNYVPDYHTKIHTGETPAFNCLKCKKVFSQRSLLKVHMQHHTGRIFHCDHCKKSFSTKLHLTNHIKTHFGGEEFCLICNKAFIQRSNLLTHIQNHYNVKPFSCDYCRKEFSTKGILTSHIRIHTGEKFKCLLCSKSYAQKLSMQKHMLKHEMV